MGTNETTTRVVRGLVAGAVALALVILAPTAPAPAGAPSAATDGGRFVTTWNGPTAYLCIGGEVNVNIDWGDGSAPQRVVGFVAGTPVVHAFAGVRSTHTVTVVGTFTNLGCFDRPLDGLVSVDEWGPTGTKHTSYAFAYSPDLVSVVEPPATVTDLSSMFEGSAFNGPIGHWDTSRVTNMAFMFLLSRFNQPLGAWDTSSVVDMREMFMHSPFNQPIGGWDTASVINMTNMFASSPFNQSIDGWNTSNVVDMGFMFEGSAFDHPIATWDISNVTNTGAMFRASSFNQPIGTWDTGAVTHMGFMFEGSSFDQPIGAWNTANVVVMDSMFADSTFDRPIGGWDTANVASMRGMFEEADSFNQDLSSWCVARIREEPSSFSTGADAWTLPHPPWGTCDDPDYTPPDGSFTSLTSSDQVRIRGLATDNVGVARVMCAIQDRATGDWLRRDRTWGAYDRLRANLHDPGFVSTRWLLARRLPPGRYSIKLIAFDTAGNLNPAPRPLRFVRVAP